MALSYTLISACAVYFAHKKKAIPTVFLTYLALSQAGMTVPTATLESVLGFGLFSPLLRHLEGREGLQRA